MTVDIYNYPTMKEIVLVLAFLVAIPFVAMANLTTDVTPASGPWSSDGAIDLEVVGGVAPYEFAWANSDGVVFSNLEDINNLLPGIYTVGVTDAMCGMASLEVGVGYDCELTIENIAPVCICESGGAEYEVSGGSGNYSYLWELVGEPFPLVFTEANPKFVDISAPDTYMLTVTDLETGCEATGSMVVDLCNGIDLAPFIDIAPDCSQAGTSTINITLPPATAVGDFEFWWTKIGEGLVKTEVSTDGMSTLENIGAGEYCLTMFSQNGCEENICNLLVEETPAPDINSNVTPVVNGNDGAISLSLTGGTGPFTYAWSNGGQTSSIQGLSEGAYSVTITHTNGDCTEVLNFDLNNCQGIIDNFENNGIEAAVTPLSANGGNASIDVTVSEYYPGYEFTFTWMQEQPGGGLGTVHVGEDLDDALPGVYWLIIRETGCTQVYSQQFIICEYTVDIELSPVDCNRTFLIAETSGHESEYNFYWTPSGNNVDITLTDYGIKNCVRITENSTDCSSYVCITPELPPIILDAQITKSTNGNENGSISVSASGGVEPYSYAWQDDPEETGPDRTDLGPGTYCVRVTDACNQTKELCVTIQCEFGSNEVMASITPVDCYAQMLGSIEITELPNVGTQNASFYFQWSGPELFTASTQNIYDLEAGNYYVTITEANSGCYAMDSYYVPAEGRAWIQLEFDKFPDCHPVNNGAITANVVGSTNGPFTYQWSTLGVMPPQYLGNGPTVTGLSDGWYQLYVEDDWGCNVNARVYLGRPKPPFRIDVTATPNKVCSPDELAVGEVEIVSGTVNGYPVTYDWQLDEPPTSYSSTNPINNNLMPGTWTVTVTDAYGCEVYGVTEVELSTLELSSEVTEYCSESTIALQVSGGAPPYSFAWGDGNTQQERTGLQNGTYTVTVTDTDNCTAEESFQVDNPNIELLTGYEVTDNGCATQCNGGIALTLSLEEPTAANVAWSTNTQYVPPLTAVYLCADDYQVTITNGDCVEEHTITVGQASGGSFTPESEVIWNFGNKVLDGGKARVEISSPLFESTGSLEVYDYDPLNPPPGTPQPPFVTVPVVIETVLVDITMIHSGVETFYVIYNHLNGCMYYGDFPAPETCELSSTPGISFSPIEHIGDSHQACGPGQNNSYELTVFSHGPNFPYFVDISVENPDLSQTLITTLEIPEGFDINDPSQNPIEVDGIPSGTIKFKTYNLCDNFFNVATHVNCCEGLLPCEEVASSTSMNGSGTTTISGQYFDIYGYHISCFDYCDFWDSNFSGNCSYVKIDIPGFTDAFNCWTGTVTISFGDGEVLSLEVVDEPGHYNDADRILANVDHYLWRPGSPGTYPFVINFVGSNGSASCTTTQYIDYFGSGNYNDIIGFQDALQDGYPAEFYDAYNSTWKCDGCVPAGTTYVMENDQDECANLSSWDHHIFNYTPTDFSNPCAGGGWLSTYEFDANGDAVIQNIPVPANPAIVMGEWGEMHQVQPIWDSNQNDWCSEYGFCLFDANIGPDPIFDAYVDKHLIVSWVNPASCESVDWGDPHSDNFNPCGGENQCSDGLICYEGSCYPPCIEGECQTGNCVDVFINGETVSLCLPDESNTDCDPPCPDDEECFEGYCYPIEVDICEYVQQFSGEANEETIFFYHNLPAGATIVIRYNTLFQPDEFYIVGSGINDHIECVFPAAQHGVQTLTYTITESPPNVVAVTAISCTEHFSSFWIEVTCQYFDDDNPVHGLIAPSSNTGIHEVSAFPNPFTSRIDIAVPDVQEPFEGETLLVDPLGSIVSSRVHSFSKGLNNMSIEGLSELAGGLYIVLIKQDGRVYASDKLVKME